MSKNISLAQKIYAWITNLILNPYKIKYLNGDKNERGLVILNKEGIKYRYIGEYTWIFPKSSSNLVDPRPYLTPSNFFFFLSNEIISPTLEVHRGYSASGGSYPRSWVEEIDSYQVNPGSKAASLGLFHRSITLTPDKTWSGWKCRVLTGGKSVEVVKKTKFWLNKPLTIVFTNDSGEEDSYNFSPRAKKS